MHFKEYFKKLFKEHFGRHIKDHFDEPRMIPRKTLRSYQGVIEEDFLELFEVQFLEILNCTDSIS